MTSEEESTVETRLVINKIVCENFKSYAGINELGPFHKCFTAIVGPNGSGKSNVIDSMLFVFGYRARKIRSKTVSVLIHNSEHHRNIQSCTVSVHFEKIVYYSEDEDNFRVIPDSQFVVSRTAHRDNTSYYNLNGKKLPFKEVSCLLKENGIDLDHNRFLILQGEVEQIALMRPKGMTEHDEGLLEFLEDIIDTSQYREPLEELGRTVNELNEKRGEKFNRFRAVEREKNNLEGAKREAEEFLAMKKEANVYQYTLYEKYKQECSQLMEKAKEKHDQLEGDINQIKAAVNDQSIKKDSKIKEQKKLFKEHDKLNDKKDSLAASLSRCHQRNEGLRQDLKNTKARLSKANENIKKEKCKLAELEGAPEKLEKDIADLERKSQILQQRKIEAENKLTEIMLSLREDTKELQDEKEGLESQLLELSRKSNQSKSKFSIAKTELELYCDKFTSGKKELQDVTEQLEMTTQAIAAKQKEIDELKISLPMKIQELSSSKKELDTIQRQQNVTSEELRLARLKLKDVKTSFESQKNRGRVLEAIMKQKELGTIPGVHGRLGDLGAIDNKYDIAISTVCGALDYIVVDDMETAVKCVEYLKKNNIGQGTFIGLDKMEVWRKKATTTIKTPENVPRLFDLIRVKDPRFLTCFYFALKDTLVADDLNQATRVGLQGKTRYRMVTLQGQIIDLSGTMSGGGNKVLRGRMSSKVSDSVSPVQVTQLEKRMEGFEIKKKDLDEKCQELNDKINNLTKEIADGKEKVKSLEREIQVLKVKENGLEERLTRTREQNDLIQIDQEHLTELEEQVQLYEKEYEAAAEKTEELDKLVKGLHDEIMRRGESKIKPQQAHIDAIDKELKEASAGIVKSTAAIKNNSRNVKKCAEKLPSLEGNVEKITKNIEDMEIEMEELKKESNEIIQEKDMLDDKLKSLSETMLVMKKEIEGYEQELKGVNEQLLDMTHEMKQYSSKIKENQSKIKHFNNEIASLDLDDEDKKDYSEEDLVNINKEEVEYEITMLEEKLKKMSPNMKAIEEYKRKEEIYMERQNELETITNERDQAKGDFEQMRKTRYDKFMTGFATITSKLKEIYQMITLGGNAELELVDSLDPFSEGIVLSVRPPKKSWKNITDLSGGEKTLSSLALVFALHHYKPSPLYVMDEIDAALDYKNVSIIASYIKERTKNCQFIIVSLRSNMFELAERLVGIYKTHDVTKSLTIEPKRIAASLATQSLAPADVSLPC